jgi:hypothetical protein
MTDVLEQAVRILKKMKVPSVLPFLVFRIDEKMDT